MTTEEQLRRDLYAAFRNRALLYHHLFETLRAELGDARAAEVMSRAIYARGTTIGRSFARFAPADFAGLRDAFLGFGPTSGGCSRRTSPGAMPAVWTSSCSAAR
jgi:hypothetical protein